MRYLPLSDADRSAMLEKVGASSIDELFRDVPGGRLGDDRGAIDLVLLWAALVAAWTPAQLD